MNRKLKHTILAFSTTGLLLVVGLMAARPLPSAMDTSLPVAAAAPAAAPFAVATRAEQREAAIEARAQRFEAEVEQAQSVEEALALSAAFVAEVAAASAIEAAFADGAAEADPETREPTPERKQRRKVRSAIALPYFSFARGLRGATGS